MKLGKYYKLDKICADDNDNREALKFVHIINGRAWATNGDALATVPIEYEESDKIKNGSLPRRAFQRLRNLFNKKEDVEFVFNFTEKHVHASNDEKTVLFSQCDEEAEGFHKPITEQFEVGAKKWKDYGMMVSFNPALLKNLADAMGSNDTVVLVIPKLQEQADGTKYPYCTKPILVVSSLEQHDDYKRYGIIMPMHTYYHDTLFKNKFIFGDLADREILVDSGKEPGEGDK